MKAVVLCLIIFLSGSINSFSQILQKKQTTAPVIQKPEQQKAGTEPKMTVTGPALKQAGSSNQNTNTKVDSTRATLRDVSFSVSTAGSNVRGPGTDKAADTHWACVLFDENGRQIASYHDNSNKDEYSSGSETPVIKMQADNTAVFGDFSKGGRLHISISPNGNDTWEISALKLTLDFINPKFVQQLSWGGIKLAQDNKDIDLFFNQVNNAVPKYDIKANKEGR